MCGLTNKMIMHDGCDYFDDRCMLCYSLVNCPLVWNWCSLSVPMVRAEQLQVRRRTVVSATYDRASGLHVCGFQVSGLHISWGVKTWSSTEAGCNLDPAVTEEPSPIHRAATVKRAICRQFLFKHCHGIALLPASRAAARRTDVHPPP